jgi:hypothetical protein
MRYSGNWGKQTRFIDTSAPDEVAFFMTLFRYRRWVASLLSALWLVATAARPSSIACPMGGHDSAHGAGHSSAQVHSGRGARGPERTTDASAHDGHYLGAHNSHSQSTPSPDAPAAPCDCLGHCCASAAHVAPVAPIITSTHTLARSPVAPTVAKTAVQPRVDVVLPFATAPPTVVVA